MKEIIIHSKSRGTKAVQVDDEDYDYLTQWRWGFHKNGNSFYVVREEKKNKQRTCFKIHRQIMNVTDKNILVDHIDGNGLNNQKSNLRLCNKSQNGANRVVKSGKTSKYIGVSWCTRTRSWLAQGRKNYKRVFSKHFKDEVAAAEYYRLKAGEIHGEFATKH